MSHVVFSPMRPFPLVIVSAVILAFAFPNPGNAAPATLEILGPAPGIQSTLVAGGDGNFYGTSYDGGDFGGGTIFRMTPAGQITILKSLQESTSEARAMDGSHPLF